jgi:hypothetical protein
MPKLYLEGFLQWWKEKHRYSGFLEGMWEIRVWGQ